MYFIICIKSFIDENNNKKVFSKILSNKHKLEIMVVSRMQQPVHDLYIPAWENWPSIDIKLLPPLIPNITTHLSA